MPGTPRTLTRPLPTWVKIHLLWRVWSIYIGVRFALFRHPLPEVVRQLSRGHPPSYRLAPRDLGRIVRRTLVFGPHQPRCLFKALVLYTLLRAQSEPAELVIGLPATPRGTEAHAWVEVAREDVGPPPGAGGHVELVRYGGVPASA